MMKKLGYADFIQAWESGHIFEVVSTANNLYGKDARGQADNPKGWILVFTVEQKPEDLEKPNWWERFKIFIHV